MSQKTYIVAKLKVLFPEHGSLIKYSPVFADGSLSAKKAVHKYVDNEIGNMEGDMHIIQVNEKICNLEREYRDCIKSRRDKIGITRHIMMHQVLYNGHVTLFIGQLHNI